MLKKPVLGMPLVAVAFAVGLGLQSLPVRAEGMDAAAMPAAKAPPHATFIDPAAFDYAKLLPAPPAAGSLEAMTDLDTILQVQGLRSAAEAEWAGTVIKGDAFSSSDIIGSWFSAQDLPVTAELFKKVKADAGAAVDAAKDVFKRERPYSVSAEVQPCVNKPGGYSYPSGYATQVYVTNGVLAELFPDKRAQLEAQARQRAWARVVGGVHFPTDLAAGKQLSQAVLARMLQSPEFRAEADKAREEIHARAGK
ncbi:MAG: phosphatase PAP2 family protein [Nevskia sp.]|nr:phosphatase PAP2 family protein [Nevskia sp.]